jgi:hypothetical protein
MFVPQETRESERMHISRTLDTYRRVFSKKLVSKVENYLSRIRVEVMLQFNKLELLEMKTFSNDLEDYMFEFEADFEKHLELHVNLIKKRLSKPIMDVKELAAKTFNFATASNQD